MGLPMARKLVTFDRLLPDFGIKDSRSTIARKEKKKQFPQRVHTSDSRIAWYSDELRDHVDNQERGGAVNHRAKKAGGDGR